MHDISFYLLRGSRFLRDIERECVGRVYDVIPTPVETGARRRACGITAINERLGPLSRPPPRDPPFHRGTGISTEQKAERREKATHPRIRRGRQKRYFPAFQYL